MMKSKSALFVSIVCGFLGACAWGDGASSKGTKPTPDAGNGNASVCGDGTCSADEVGVCVADCGNGGSNGSGSGSNPTSCGNFTCEANLGEDTTTCPADCGGGSGSGGGTLDCNDQNVQLACVACLLGAGCTGVSEADCTACLGGGGGGGGTACEGGVPDGTCNPAAGENTTTCPFDCM